MNPEGAEDVIEAGVFVEPAPLLNPVARDRALAELGVISPIGMTFVALSEAVAMLAWSEKGFSGASNRIGEPSSKVRPDVGEPGLWLSGFSIIMLIFGSGRLSTVSALATTSGFGSNVARLRAAAAACVRRPWYQR